MKQLNIYQLGTGFFKKKGLLKPKKVNHHRQSKLDYLNLLYCIRSDQESDKITKLKYYI